MAGARAAVERRKASALRSARAASDDAANSFAPSGALPPLIFSEANTSCRSLPKLGCGCIARTSELVRHPEVAAKRPSKDVGPSAEVVALRGSLRSHLRVTETTRAQALRTKKDQERHAETPQEIP
jgi:hypothetical protein